MASSFLKLMGVKHPIVSAPMSGAAGGALAGAVSRAGGYGFVAWNASHPPSALSSEIQIAGQALASSPLSISSPSIGVGFLCWSLSALSPSSFPSTAAPLTSSSTEPSSTDRPDPSLSPTDSSSSFSSFSSSSSTAPKNSLDDRHPLDIALSSPIVSAIWLFAGDTLHWAREIRRREAAAAASKKAPVKIFIQVSSLDSALSWIDLSHQSSSSSDIDALVLQSSEAGGHGSPSSIPLSTLLPSFIRSLPPSSSSIPVLAAGGLMLGEHLASALSMGASGAVFGTRFLLSEESCYGREKKEAIRCVEVGRTERSDAWDKAIGKGWPEEFDARGISNLTSSTRPSLDLSDPSVLTSFRDRYKQAVVAGDLSRAAVWAGTGAGLVREIMPAEEIVKELAEDCGKALERGKETMSEGV